LLNEKDSNRLSIEIEFTGFFKNNEYFSPVSKGETFPGVRMRPTVSYQIDSKLDAELGMVGLYYSGDNQKDKTYVFNGIFAKLQYSIRPNLNLIFGNYYGGVNHRLIEPLYKWEKHLVDKPESGLQFIFENEKYFSDTWLNWQRFIQHGDSVPEVLTFGTSNSIKLTSPKSRISLSVPLQLVIHHQGGQIDTSSEKMIVSGNLATGICSELSLNNRFFKSVGLNIYWVGYYDKIENRETRPYTKGWGIYPVFTVDATPFKGMLGFWRADKFFSFEGEPLFASFNPLYSDSKLEKRNILTMKLSYSKQLHKMFSLGAQIETYSDLDREKTDYSFGIYLRVSGTIFQKLFSRH